MRPIAERFASWRWRTVTATYRNGVLGAGDAVASFDWVASEFGAAPACVYGESSGGHWALTLAAERTPELLVVAAAPTDLLTWSEAVPDPAARHYVADLIWRIFGSDPDDLTRHSPARKPWPRASAERLVLIYGETDPIVPVDQARALVSAAPGSKLVTLPPGEAPWIHLAAGSGVDAAALDRAFHYVRTRLEALA